ncbi:MAG TPA: MSMEG_1061 family FMN-dependent PPOX-type flavoprotein [Thermomicrobiales bacterium]|nr:MSMEG_1061 family FMN-dependent PPOX-type flavoprotein [Thermomicrobiales bacterium]
MSLDLNPAAAGTIGDIAQLEALVGSPKQTSVAKESVGMTELEQEFVRQSPFYLLSTAAPDGTCDVSPRGDPPGSVWVACDRTLILADRPGNRRLDSLRNIVANPHVGLLFLVPGGDETLRINGRAHLTTHESILGRLVVDGKRPKLAIVVHTEQVYMHCARAFLRSKLWKPETWPERGSIPQMPAIFKEKLCLAGSIEEIAAEREGRYQTEPLF